MATLQVIKGANVGHCYELVANESVLGRYPFCEVVLPSHTVSRQHARIVRVGNKCYVEDLNSLNGTFLNGERVRKRTLLKDQDRIRIYEILLLFHEGAVRPMPASPSSEARLAETLAFKPDEPEEAQPATVVNVLELQQGESTLSHEKLKHVLEATRALGGCTDLEQLLPMMLDAVFQIFPHAGRGHVLLLKKEGTLVPRTSKHRLDDVVASATFGPISDGFAGRAVREAVAILSSPEAAGDVLEGPSRSTMCAPLLGPSRSPLGVLQLEADGPSQQFGREDLDLLISVGLVSGQAVEYALLLSGP